MNVKNDLEGWADVIRESNHQRREHQKKYPQTAKLREVHGQWQTIIDFVTWLQETKTSVTENKNDSVGLASKYFGIDLEALSKEEEELYPCENID